MAGCGCESNLKFDGVSRQYKTVLNLTLHSAPLETAFS